MSAPMHRGPRKAGRLGCGREVMRGELRHRWDFVDVGKDGVEVPMAGVGADHQDGVVRFRGV